MKVYFHTYFLILKGYMMGGQRKRKQHLVVRKQRKQGVVGCVHTHVLLFLRFFSCFEVKENPQAAISLSVCMLVYTPNKTLTLTLA